MVISHACGLDGIYAEHLKLGSHLLFTLLGFLSKSMKVGLYFWRSQAPLTPPRSALVCGISWRVPIGVSMRKRRSKKYKQIRRKTLLYAFEKRMKACQSAWRRRKYKPTLIDNVFVPVGA